MTKRVTIRKRPTLEPVAWRVRGYAQFKTGTPRPWRYVDGAEKPVVNNPDDCDFEPLFAASVAPAPVAMTPDWQPIETAPKDGTSILGYWMGGKHDCAIHATKFHRGRWWEPNEDIPQCAPSHWMPLPSAPAALAAPGAPAPAACPTCGADEPFTGSCGTSESDTKALCRRAPAPVAVTPDAWLWQHEETGNTGFVDAWQVENGWQAANPRNKIIFRNH